jgi:hypothetical protein
VKREALLKRDIKTNKKFAWKLQSELVRKQSDGICFTCFKHFGWRNLDCGHCVHSGVSGNWLLDHDERNLRGQCVGCNQYRSGNLSVYINRLEAIYGYGVLQELMELKHKLYMPTNEEVVEKILELKELLKEFPE